jgi:hypothetical protein
MPTPSTNAPTNGFPQQPIFTTKPQVELMLLQHVKILADEEVIQWCACSCLIFVHEAQIEKE